MKPPSYPLVRILGIIAVASNLLCFVASQRGDHLNADFKMFYATAEALRTGNGSRIYDSSLAMQLEAEAVPGLHSADVQVYTHPPFELVFYLPLSFLPYRTAFFLWQIASICLALFSASVLAALAETNFKLTIYALVLGSFPFLESLLIGQDSALLLLFLTAALFAFQKGNYSLAGALLSVALFRFPLIVPLAALLSARRPQLLKGILPVGLLLGVLSLILVGPSGVLAYAEYLIRMARDSGTQISELYHIDPRKMPTLRGLAFLIHVPVAALPLGLLIALACVWSIWQSEDPMRQFSVAILGACLLSPHSLLHDLAILAIPTALLGTPALPLLGFYLAPVVFWSYPPTQALLAILIVLSVILVARETFSEHTLFSSSSGRCGKTASGRPEAEDGSAPAIAGVRGEGPRRRIRSL